MFDTIAAARALIAAKLPAETVYAVSAPGEPGTRYITVREGRPPRIEYDTTMVWQLIDVACHDADEAGARALWGQVHDALHRVGRTLVTLNGQTLLCYLGWCALGPQDDPDPDTRRPMTFASYSLAWADRPITPP